ncbi:MAG TPA: fatty acid desaturase [Acidimicrobiia bacterium]|nr:fatty acid desaturase [Acidimicrobiia bacterium]
MSVARIFLASALVTQASVFATTVYLHRVLAHRALTIRPAVAMVFRLIIWIMTGITPRAWVAVHRRHHAFSDLPQDPHSPVQLGFWAVQIGNAKLYRDTIRDGVTVTKYSRDLPPDRLDRMLFDHAFLGLAIGIGFLIVVLGPVAGLLAAGIHTVVYLSTNAAINAVGHTFGKRPYDNLATNNQWLAWISGGEGLHNNHHAAPTSARFALDRGQADPGWWLIRLLLRTNQAAVRHEEIKLKQPA